MADVVHVNFGALQTSAQTLQAKAAALTQYLEELNQNLQPLKATWATSGSSAGTAADQAQVRLSQAANDIVAIINQFGAKTFEAHDQQYALEQQNTSYFA